MDEDSLARQQAASERIAALINELRDLIGPTHCGDDDCEACTNIGTPRHIPNLMMDEYVLLVSWTDLDSDNSYSTITCPPTMRRTHRIGLLADWVDTVTRG